MDNAKINDIDPPRYLTDVFERVVTGRTKINQLNTLLPWNWNAERDNSQSRRLISSTARRRELPAHR
jgi:transposase